MFRFIRFLSVNKNIEKKIQLREKLKYSFTQQPKKNNRDK